MQDFKRESILQALSNIDMNPSLRSGRESIEYNLEFNGKKYPPILVLSEASKIQGGGELKLSDFGSTAVAFKFLRDHGFTVNKKIRSFYDEIVNFLKQAQTSNLTTNQYLKEYSGLKVKTSFGQGYPARIPWIAFLGGNNTVSDGIYPVYLYFKSKELLILAYGISETTSPQKDWKIEAKEKISSYFQKRNLGVPDRYGNSYVFKVYNTVTMLDEHEINRDLDSIVETYKQNLSNTEVSNISDITMPELKRTIPEVKRDNSFDYKLFFDALEKANLFFNADLGLRFIAALLTKPFVILTGLSGSGKTKLAQAFSKWITESDKQVCIVPVGADWTNREPLLGYPNALKMGEYILPENGALELILEASKDENMEKPFFLILDEMNLSHVERYFADFLSAMESGEAIPLHSTTDEWKSQSVPSKVKLPKNLFLIGTVNVDETTYMFSPKVLDRANVIEFRVTEEEMASYLDESRALNLDVLTSQGSNASHIFLQFSKSGDIQFEGQTELNTALLSFFRELKVVGAEFGYRSAFEILKFGFIVRSLEPSWSIDKIIDAAIMQKLLPKVHGSRRKLEPVLKTLGSLCLLNGQSFDDVYTLTSSSALSGGGIIKYPISFEKITRMYRGLLDNGFTSYAEA